MKKKTSSYPAQKKSLTTIANNNLINLIKQINMQKQIARYWVIQNGADCDGYNRGGAVGFGSRVEAERYANNGNEWSDGIIFHVISDFDELLKYCHDYDIGVPQYAHETMETPSPPILFARKCSVTGEGMNAGWIVNDGDYYFKYEEDALAHAKEMGYEDLDEAYENDDFYYTEWEDESDYEWELIDGVLVEL